MSTVTARRAVTVDHRVAPHVLVDLVALEHAAARLGQQVEQLDLAPREVDALTADELTGHVIIAGYQGHGTLGRKLVDLPLLTDARSGGERTVRVGSGGKSARTQFRLVQHFGSRASLLEATLETGRTHQIRVHAAHCGHPVAGDEKYGDATANEALRALGLRRMFLHAHSISLDWPLGGQLSVSAPLPTELKQVIDALAGAGPDSRVRAGRSRRHAGSRRAG